MLSLSNEDYFLEEVDSHIQANLEDKVVQEALKNGVDLREYSQQVEDELKKAENSCINDFIRESQNIAALHHEIVDCDHILERMESMLISFQDDLGSISNEILSLQQQSVDMSVKLKNRQAVRGELTQFVDEVVVPEAMLDVIFDTPVSEPVYLEQLQNLEQKIEIIKDPSFGDTRSCIELKDTIEKAKIKAIGKTREFLLEKINAFRKPMSNFHIPQEMIVKHKFYYKFLVTNNREVAKEVRDHYIDTLSKILFSYFKSYAGRLMKLLHEEPPTQDDLLGVDDSVSQSKGFFSSKPSLKSKASVFSMGQRGQVISTDFDKVILVPHTQERDNKKYGYERIFSSEQKSLNDHAVREYQFLSEFFMVQGAAADELFHQVMDKTLVLLQGGVEDYVSGCFDCIALFLCAHLVIKYRDFCRSKKVPSMERYWGSILAIIWPKLQKIIQLNVQSVRDCDPQKMKNLDLRPHFVIRRFAELSAAFVSINENCTDDAFHNLLSGLNQEIDLFIQRLSSVFSRKESLVFAINNYDLILSVMGEKSSGESRDSEGFRMKFNKKTDEYIEQVLWPPFGDLIRFCVEAENLLAENKGIPASMQSRAEPMIAAFNEKWKTSLDTLNKEVLGSFPNFRNGTDIVQRALTQFVQYYHRFQKVMASPELINHSQKVINVHQIIVEVKKYKTSF